MSIRCVARSSPDIFIFCTDIFIPSTIGFAKVIRVQIAAIPIQPAPIKRTFSFQTAIAKDSTDLASPIGKILVKYGTKPPQAIIIPTKIAIPLEIPIRKPAPSKAVEKPSGNCVTPRPIPNQKLISPAR